MSYHNDPYRVDYLKIYPCLKERPDVLEVLKKSDRKMKYMEVDLKSEQRRKNAENGAESYIPSKEDSLERLVYSAKCQFADDAEGVEEVVIRKDDLCRLRAALDQLSEEEKSLIRALFFDERSERELEEMKNAQTSPSFRKRRKRKRCCAGSAAHRHLSGWNKVLPTCSTASQITRNAYSISAVLRQPHIPKRRRRWIMLWNSSPSTRITPRH